MSTHNTPQPAATSTTESDTPIIQIQDLRNQFGSHVVHEHLDLDVYKGEIIGFVGGSGTGYSVLLRANLGLRRPHAGRIHVFGQSLFDLKDRGRAAIERRFGVLFQQGALFSSLTTIENVAMPLIEHAGLSHSEAEDLALLKMVLAGLPENAANRYPSELSGGMRKRAAMARALALDPDILFLDEPTAGLDPIAAAELDQLIHTLRDAIGLTVFMVTHDIDSLHAIADRVAVLAARRVVVADTLDKVERFDDPWVREYFHGPRARMARTAHAQA